MPRNPTLKNLAIEFDALAEFCRELERARDPWLEREDIQRQLDGRLQECRELVRHV